MADVGHGSTPCDHKWTYREIDGRTWEVCIRCGFGEQWEGGSLVRTTDPAESERLDALIPEAERG